jgi:hypothetical protein
VEEILLVAGGGALIASLARDGWLSRLLSFRQPLVVRGVDTFNAIFHEFIAVQDHDIAWWRNVTAKGQFCDMFDKANATLA